LLLGHLDLLWQHDVAPGDVSIGLSTWTMLMSVRVPMPPTLHEVHAPVSHTIKLGGSR
jgi:hypothetical protein